MDDVNIAGLLNLMKLHRTEIFEVLDPGNLKYEILILLSIQI